MKQKLIKSNSYVGVALDLCIQYKNYEHYRDVEFSVVFGLNYTLNKNDWTIIDLI